MRFAPALRRRVRGRPCASARSSSVVRAAPGRAAALARGPVRRRRVDPNAPCSPARSRDCYYGPGRAPTASARATAGRGPAATPGRGASAPARSMPRGEICGNGVDDNCNGMVDEDVDLDGDGFTTCGGDCCDSDRGLQRPGAGEPGRVRGAGQQGRRRLRRHGRQRAAATCDTGLRRATRPTRMDYAQGDGPLPDHDRRPATEVGRDQRELRARRRHRRARDASRTRSAPAFGADGAAQVGDAMVVLSTGTRRPAGRHRTRRTRPSRTRRATGNDIERLPGGLARRERRQAARTRPAARTPTAAARTIRSCSTLRIRVPTNAQVVQLATNFFSAEFPEWTCSPYNDFFVVLLDSTYTGTPGEPDRQEPRVLPADAATMQKYPGRREPRVRQHRPVHPVHERRRPAAPTAPTAARSTRASGTDAARRHRHRRRRRPSCDAAAALAWAAAPAGSRPAATSTRGEIITLRIAIWDTSDHASTRSRSSTTSSGRSTPPSPAPSSSEATGWRAAGLLGYRAMFVCPECGAAAGDRRLCAADGAALDDRSATTRCSARRSARTASRGCSGVGGMGRVYGRAAADRQPRRDQGAVARVRATAATCVERFFAEARAVNLIRHESIVNVLDLGAARPTAGRTSSWSTSTARRSSAILARQPAPLPLGGLARLVGRGARRARRRARARASSTAISSPTTSSSRRAGRAKVLDFGIAKLAPALRGGRRARAPARCSARRTTCRPSRRSGGRSTRAPTSTRSA